MQYTSIQAAAEIGTTPKLLRRFLRSNDSWINAGNGGRYSFTESEMKSLKLQFKKWRDGMAPVKRRASDDDTLSYLDQDKGITVEDMLRLPTDSLLRDQVRQRRIERQRRLEMRMIEVGVRPVPQYEEA